MALTPLEALPRVEPVVERRITVEHEQLDRWQPSVSRRIRLRPRSVSLYPPLAKQPLRSVGVIPSLLWHVQLRRPSAVKFCVQRSSRREVLFARGVAGRRGSAPGPYRRTQRSYYGC